MSVAAEGGSRPAMSIATRQQRVLLLLGAVCAFIGVGAGAFGAHGLRALVAPDLLVVFETGARYQMYHAFALLACAWAAGFWPGRRVAAAGALFLVGILLFSGSLYLLALTGLRGLGAITPLGGVAFLAGWACLAAAPFGQAATHSNQETP